MKYDEHPFDVARLWAPPKADARQDPGAARREGRKRPPAPPQLFPARAAAPPDATLADAAPPTAVLVQAALVKAAPPKAVSLKSVEETQACLARTRGELLSIATSLAARDALRRGWIADRCASCRLCPEMGA